MKYIIDYFKKIHFKKINVIYTLGIVLLIIISGFFMKYFSRYIKEKNTNTSNSHEIHNNYKNYSSKGKYYLYYNDKIIDDIKEEVDSFYLNNLSTAIYYSDSNDNEIYHNNYDSIALFGLKSFSLYEIFKDKKYYEYAKNQFDYLVNNLSSDGKFYINENNRIYSNYVGRWYAANTNGYFLSLLARIYSVEKSEVLFRAGERAIIPFKTSVTNGGCVDYFLDYKFYETYPNEEQSTFNLTGFLNILIGLKDYGNIVGNTEAIKLYNDGINSLEYVISFYDNDNGLSSYDLMNYFKPGVKNSSAKYHKENIQALQLINSLNHKKVFKFYIDRWNEYLDK